MQKDAAVEPPVISSSARSWITLLVVAVIVVVLASIIVPMVLQARDAARRTQSKNNLKQIGLALHNYHDVYSTLPIGWDTEAGGKTKHGAWTRILPFLFSSPVYSWVNFDREWNHPVNEWIFRSSSIHLENPAASQIETGDGFIVAHYAFNQELMHQNKGLAFKDLPRPFNQVCLAAEVGDHFVPWGYPWQSRDADLPLNSTPKSFGRPIERGAFIAFADGSVQWVPNSRQSGFLTVQQSVDPNRIATPEYPQRFGDHPTFQSIRVLHFGKGITEREYKIKVAEVVESAMRETPNAAVLIAPDWHPSPADVEHLKSLEQLRHLVIGGTDKESARSEILKLQTLTTIVISGQVVRNKTTGP